MEEKSSCRLRGGKGIGKWWENRICPRCGEEEETPDDIMFRCRKIKRIKLEDVKGREEESGTAGTHWQCDGAVFAFTFFSFQASP